jgi:hypothetical protein
LPSKGTAVNFNLLDVAPVPELALAFCFQLCALLIVVVIPPVVMYHAFLDDGHFMAFSGASWRRDGLGRKEILIG